MLEVSYKDSTEHILEELELLTLRLRNAVSILRTSFETQRWRENAAFFISDEEIEYLLKGRSANEIANPVGLHEEIKDYEKDIEQKLQQSLKNGVCLNLQRLRQSFFLSRFELNAVIICLAPELDPKFERVYAYIQDDMTRKKPTMNLILDLLCNSLSEKISYRKLFSYSSKLFAARILRVEQTQESQFIHDGAPGNFRLLAPIRIDEHILNFILGIKCIDPKICDFVHLNGTKLDQGSQRLHYPKFLEEKILATVRQWTDARESNPPLFYFHADYGSGKESLARSMASELAHPMLVADLRKASGRADFEEAITLLFRESLLHDNALVFLKNIDILRPSESSERLTDTDGNDSNKEVGEYSVKFEAKRKLEIILEKIKDFSRNMVILAGEIPLSEENFRGYNSPIRVTFPSVSYAMRKKMWESSLRPYNIEGPLDLEDLTGKFRFTHGQILDAITTAKSLRWITSQNGGVDPGLRLSARELYEGCRLQSNMRLSKLAQKIISKHRLDDITLPREKTDQLREILSYVKFRNAIYEEWGFGQKLSAGKGINILFAGESGTGKTMAAGIIANELGLDIFKIDLSAVVSKWIGQTEKNIEGIFREARTSNSILFFDECDAIFGKRSEIKDAHDRYANIEISYLLQKLEDHDEIVILASNIPKNIDDAFGRRMSFWVEFPFPDVKYRLKIWENIFPSSVPVSDNLDFEFLSRQFRISGGIIKNIAVAAAFIAKELKADTITMEHIIRAVKREFDKMGKPCMKSEFDKYYGIIDSIK